MIRRNGQVAQEKPAANDQALAERVRSEIFCAADAPKDSVNVNVANGAVHLRGEVRQPDEINRLVEQAREVDGSAPWRTRSTPHEPPAEATDGFAQ